MIQRNSSSPQANWVKLDRETLDLAKFRMLKTMDGCGSELAAIIAFIEEEAIINTEDIIGSTDEDILDSTEEFADIDMLADVGDEDITEDEQESEQIDDEFFADMVNQLSPVLPLETTVLKHDRQSTSFNQAHDNADCHKTFKD
jgi:hypothetical protein